MAGHLEKSSSALQIPGLSYSDQPVDKMLRELSSLALD